jgi:hypothetical protein
MELHGVPSTAAAATTRARCRTIRLRRSPEKAASVLLRKPTAPTYHSAAGTHPQWARRRLRRTQVRTKVRPSRRWKPMRARLPMPEHPERGRKRHNYMRLAAHAGKELKAKHRSTAPELAQFSSNRDQFSSLGVVHEREGTCHSHASQNDVMESWEFFGRIETLERL